MIGIDTNVLVRFLVQDDVEQGRLAGEAMATLSVDSPGFLSTIVLVETYWVLRRAYQFEDDQVLSTLAEVVAAEEIVVQDAAQVTAAITAARAGADLADALIAQACAARGCREVWSFDASAQQKLGSSALQQLSDKRHYVIL